MKQRFLIVALLLFTMLGGLFSMSTTPQTVAQTTTIAVTGDAYVSQGAPNQNFGASSRLRVDFDSGNTVNMESYLELASACPEATCTLHLYADSAYNGTLNFSFNPSDFDQNTITWATAPIDSSGLSQLVTPAAGWMAVSIPQGTVRIRVQGTSTTQYPFYSIEAGTNVPYVDYANPPTQTPTNTAVPPTNTPLPPTATNTPVPPTATNTATNTPLPLYTSELEPTDDATVNSAQPTTNFGTQQTLRASTASSGTQEAFLLFGDDGGMECTEVFIGVDSLKLRFYNNNTAATGNLTFKALGVVAPFDENTVTWDTKPSFLSQFSVTIPAPTTVGFFEVTFPPSDSSDGKFVGMDGCTITVQVTSSGSSSPQLFSRQYSTAANRPHLIVTQYGGPISQPTSTPLPPTATNTAAPPTATNTPVPPTATNTPLPTATNTAVPPTATNTAVPTATTAPTTNVTFPARAAFYYPWFPEAWTQLGINPYSHYTPTLGYYDTGNSTVVENHIAQLESAGFDVAILSWWGQTHHTNADSAVFINAANDNSVKAAFYYEKEGSANPTQSEITSDLNYLKNTYGNNASVAKINGRIVVFVYNADDTTCEVVDRWKAANTINAYLVMKVFTGYASCTNQPDAWHQYGPASRESNFAADGSYSISPGFYKADEADPRLARNETEFATAVRNMVASNANWQLVISFNEWGEGTGVESTTQFGNTYLNILAADGNVATPTPTNTNVPPTATSTATAVASGTMVANGDAYVRDDMPTTNFGTETELRTDANAPIYYSFIEFPSACPVSCVLNINSPNASSGTVTVYATGDFVETTITWNTKPLQGSQLAQVTSPAAGWVQFTLPAGTQRVMITNTSGTRWPFSSREGANPPFVSWGTVSTTPTPTAVPTATRTATATPSAGTVGFWAVGDIMDDTTPNTGKWVNADRVGQLVDTGETVVTLGDHQYESGTLTEFQTYFDVSTWGDLKDKGVLRPVVGNHEYNSGGSGYYTYFGAAAHGPNGYYTFTQGSVTFIVINTNCSKISGGCSTTGPQGQMITQAMQNANGCTVLAGHHPAFTSSARTDGEPARPLFALFDSLGGDIALYGHEHSYERFVPIDGSGNLDPAGVQLIVAGTGGKRGGTFDVVEQGSAVRITNVDGAVHFTVNGNNYSYEFVDIDGVVRDSGSGTCQ